MSSVNGEMVEWRIAIASWVKLFPTLQLPTVLFMVKIIARQSLGYHSVYDLGVERDHNFLLANGLVASNCFNKSHSTAYAYVTYQTAYLKANYPVEYMAALLTAAASNSDKVEKYIETCRKMNIDVEPPDINRSQVDFTPLKDKILFGLSAVRNVGLGAIENLLAARENAGGKFVSLADLCTRIDQHAVKRSALEALIYCGAFDRLQSNRQQLINDLELIWPWAQKRAKEKESGQISIFESFSDAGEREDTAHEHAPSAPAVADFSPAEKLKQEKELLGFYVSDHPLKAARQAATLLAPINLGELAQIKSKTFVSAIALLAEVKAIVTKKGDRMAFVQLEDISGQAEGVVFPETFKRISACLEEDARLVIWGKVDRKDDRVQLIVNDAEPIERVRMVLLELTPEEAMDRHRQQRLQSILQEHSGERNRSKIPVIGVVSAGEKRQFVRFGEQYWVQDYATAIDRLNATGFNARATPLLSS